MDQTELPPWWPTPLHEAVTTKTAGATGVARLAIDGLLEIIEDGVKAKTAATILSDRLPGYAPIWHIGRAVHTAFPAEGLREIRHALDAAVQKSVETAVQWVQEQGGPVAVAPSSSIVAQVLDRLGPQITQGTPVVGLAGADAIGTNTVLNIKGTADVARRVPTLVVTTSLKLVPETVFARLGAPVFERIPLSSFVGVVLDGEILHPELVGKRAVALSE
jgi:hypothetical protein